MTEFFHQVHSRCLIFGVQHTERFGVSIVTVRLGGWRDLPGWQHYAVAPNVFKCALGLLSTVDDLKAFSSSTFVGFRIRGVKEYGLGTILHFFPCLNRFRNHIVTFNGSLDEGGSGVLS